MFAKKFVIFLLLIKCILCSSALYAEDKTTKTSSLSNLTLSREALAKQLGWIENNDNNCGGYYLEQPILPVDADKPNAIHIFGNHGILAQRGTSFLEDKVIIIRAGQQINADQAYVYRDDAGKISYIDMIGDVHLREPNTLIIGKKGRYNVTNKTKSILDIIYRTSLNGRQVAGPKIPQDEKIKERKITLLTAWGKAYEFSQTGPKIYELITGTFSTCPPRDPAWELKSSHIVINKNTGRGYATNARFLVKNKPIFYLPYISFSIDKQRKTGFLWPTFGIGSNKWGPYFLAPFYWNMAPNYDMTITPGILTKRGVQLSDHFRYLTSTSSGDINLSVLPGDVFFKNFKRASAEKYASATNPITQSELNRLLNSSNIRHGFFFRDDSAFNEHWSSHVDFNYAGDDYYLRDFGNNLNEISENQLIQIGDLYYKGQNWYFTGRLQAYQTLHPIDEPQVTNQYRRFPQLILNGDFPDQIFGLNYFINNEVTHFEFVKTPGTEDLSPVGNRIHTQPGISWPLYLPYFYLNPRFQLALTTYDLENNTNAAPIALNPHRAVPIFDVALGFAFNRDLNFFSHAYEQTLEPQAYYTFIPYRNQQDIPIFDTTVNTLTYDQIFNYNRFTGLDRIGDANQMAFGVTSRVLDKDSGLEKVRVGLGGIVFFANRVVTMCKNDNLCSNNPDNHSNYQRLSPLSGFLNYKVNPLWSLNSTAIWNPVSKQLDNSAIALQYIPGENKLINFGYAYARSGDIYSGISSTDSSNNLKVTDLSFSWPIMRDVSTVAQWTQNWNHRHLQNLIYGIQYDSCCWAVRLVGGREFTGLDPTNNNKPLYNSELYVQFAIKGMGNIGSGNPRGLLRNINGYNPNFGQDI